MSDEKKPEEKKPCDCPYHRAKQELVDTMFEHVISVVSAAITKTGKLPLPETISAYITRECQQIVDVTYASVILEVNRALDEAGFPPDKEPQPEPIDPGPAPDKDKMN